MCNRNNHFTAEKIKLLPKTSIQCKKKTKNKKQKKITAKKVTLVSNKINLVPKNSIY